MPLDFTQIQAVVMDMDGVLWRSEQALNGMQDFIAFLRQQNIPFALATNNSGKTPADYVAKFARLGVPDMPQSRIVTSGTATAAQAQAHDPPQTRREERGRDG